ncbi:MAG: outer membrane beta-barrel protein [Woeseiaceae bacterium]|nr:outer membrane beta-barrel protein [Woeseiaceae bacterium]
MSRTALLAVLVATAVSARAADEPTPFEITPIGGYRIGGSFDVEASDASYDLDEASATGLILNLRDDINTQWELLWSRQDTVAVLQSAAVLPPRVDIDIETLQIGGTYQGDGDRLRPYLAATLGATRIETARDADTFLSGSIGVGLQLLPNSRIGLRVEARAHGALVDADTDLFCETGPSANLCAIRIEGDLLGQFEAFAGLVLRF